MIPLRLALVIGATAIVICTARAKELVAGDPWAIGYGGHVALDCAGWQLERREILAERGILPRMKPGSDMLAMNGAFQKLYYEGQGAAEADRRRTKDFCRHVPAAVGSRWRRLARVLRRTDQRVDEEGWRGRPALQVIGDVVDVAPASFRLSQAPYPQGIDESVDADARHIRFAQALLADKPQFMTVYLAGIDHAEHHGGPGSSEAKEAIERTDALVGDLVAAARSAMPDVTVVLVSGHGFMPITTDINLFRSFLVAGLVTLGSDGKVTGWQAMPWLAGDTAAIRLTRPNDPALVARVAKMLAAMAADPDYHIVRVLDRSALLRQGGAADASFFVALAPGYETGRDPTAPVALHRPTRACMATCRPSRQVAMLIVAGPGIARGRRLDVVDMRAIAPAMARVLVASLPSIEVSPAFQPSATRGGEAGCHACHDRCDPRPAAASVNAFAVRVGPGCSAAATMPVRAYSGRRSADRP